MPAMVASSASFHANHDSQSERMATSTAACKVPPHMINTSDGPWGAGHSQAAVGIAFRVLAK